MITFRRETYDQCIDDIKELVQNHYDEAAVFDFKFKPHFHVYKVMEEGKLLHVYTARDGDLLVGYIVSFITKHIHYDHVDLMMNDLIYIRPEYRAGGTINEFLESWVEHMKELKVNMVCVPTHNKGLIRALGQTEFSQMDIVMARKL